MKKIVILMVLLIMPASLVLAQTKTPIAGHVSTKNFAQSGGTNTPTHAFNIQLRKSMETINKDVKSGKLTKSQALTARGQVKTIRVQELQFFKENGNKELTSSQLTQLTQSLTQLSSSL